MMCFVWHFVAIWMYPMEPVGTFLSTYQGEKCRRSRPHLRFTMAVTSGHYKKRNSDWIFVRQCGRENIPEAF
jgi:hypothetical protein